MGPLLFLGNVLLQIFYVIFVSSAPYKISVINLLCRINLPTG